MRALILTASLAALLLSGCSKPAGPGAASPEAMSSEAGSPAARTGSDKAAKAPVIGAPSLAYAYAYALVAPAQRIDALVALHQRACGAAGPQSCQVTGSMMEARGRDDVHASLSLRGDPVWLAAFGDRIGADAKAAGGRLSHATVTSEDLSRKVIDAQATIRAKTALRDRLQSLLEARPGKASDFLEIATDLSNVQGELDADQSELAAMRERLATSVLTIDYESLGVLGGDATWRSLAEAITGSGDVLARTLGVMVTCLAALLPWVLLIAAGVWLARLPVVRRIWSAAGGPKRPVPPRP